MGDNYCNIQDGCKLLNAAIAQYNLVVEQNRNLQQELQPFRINYFRNLSTKHIAALAQKSIALTDENMKYYHFFEDIKEICDQLTDNGMLVGEGDNLVAEIYGILKQVLIEVE